MIPIVCRMLLVLLTRDADIGVVRHCEIIAESEDTWSIRPIAGETLEYRALEISWHACTTPLPRITGIGAHMLYVYEHGDIRKMFISPDTTLESADIRIISPRGPGSAALVMASESDAGGRERVPGRNGHVWVFRRGLQPPEPWRNHGMYPLSLPGESQSTEPGRFRTDGTGRFTTTCGWRLDTASHPVACIQYQVDSGLGSSTIAWDTDKTGQVYSLTVDTHPSGAWNQKYIPLYTHRGWNGEVETISFFPSDHPARVQIDWITLPTLGKPWSWIINATSGQLLAFGVIFIAGFATLYFRRSPNHGDIRCVLAGACAVTPILLPFTSLQANLQISGMTMPLYLIILTGLSLHTIVLFRGAWIVLTAILCFTVTAAHACIVAGGRGLETLPVILAGPVSFLASYGISSEDHRRAGIRIIVGVVTLSGILAAGSRFLGTDPLYGSLLRTIGRMYRDIASEGRIAGAFVHPLVLASCGLISVSVLRVSVPKSSMRYILFAVLGFIVILTHSRSAILVLFCMICLMTTRRNTRRIPALIIGGFFMVIVFVMTRGSESQGIGRDLHLSRRTDGLRVAAGTMARKPLQGVGFGNYKRALRRFGPDRAVHRSYTTPDSSYVRLITEGGIMGATVWFLWLIALFTRRSHRASTGDHKTAFSGWRTTLIVVFFLAGVFDAFYWPAFSVPAFALLGFMKR